MHNSFLKKLIAILGTCAVFVTALVLPFIFKPKMNTRSMLVNADEVVSDNYFDGSNLYFPYALFIGTDFCFSSCTIKVSNYSSLVKFSFKNNDIYAVIYGNPFTPNTICNGSLDLSACFSSTNMSKSSYVVGNTDIVWFGRHLVVGDMYYSIYAHAGVDCDFDFKGVNIRFVVCPSGTFNNNVIGFNTRDCGFFIVRYFGFDSEGNLDTTNFVEIALPTFSVSGDVGDFVYEERTYYFTRVDTDSSSYSEGYNAGQSAGYTIGESAGYKQGYSVGDTQGYTRGYNAGVNDSNDYTFVGLISAVIDAPIKAFTGLLNFEILGVNLAGFVLGSLSLLIILICVRKFLL